MHSTHLKGLLGELEFTTHMLKLGYSVYKPINPNSSCDIVIEKNNRLQRVQVEYLSPKNGMLRIELDRPKRRKNKYQIRGVDAMGVYDPIHNLFLLIALKHIKNKSEFWVRLEGTKNNQKKDVHLAQDYII